MPGFIVTRSIAPALLALTGEHRFARYALVFSVDSAAGPRSRPLETRAEFPARWARLSGGVIGSRGHVARGRILRRSSAARFSS